MSPEDVLACIRDGYRFAEQLDPESEPGLDLTFESMIGEWRLACDLVDSHKLGRALNDWFGVRAGDEEWQAVLEPPKGARLRGVCELVSRLGARRPTVRPFRVAGRDCLEAGAFMTLRTALSEAGAPVADARPSTSLASVARDHSSILVTVLGKLAPGVLPVPSMPTSRVADLGAKALLASLLLVWLIPVVKSWWYSGLVGLLLAVGILSLWWSARDRGWMVEFGELRTLGDLARRIATHDRDRAI